MWFQKKARPTHHEGQIIKFFPEKGYGFITTPDERRFFLHIRDCIGDYTPQRFDEVRFTPAQTQKGDRARQVEFLRRGTRPLEYPNRILYSRDGRFPGGFTVQQELGIVTSQDRRFADARRALLRAAQRRGANAVLITREWQTRHARPTAGAFINLIGMILRPSLGKLAYAMNTSGIYYYRKANFQGKAVIVARPKR